MSSRLALFVCLLLGCTTEPAPLRHAPSTTVETAHEAVREAASDAPAPRDVTFVTTDGVTIAGTLTRAARVDAPAVILVHQLASTRAEWAPLLPHLAADPSMTVLAIDMRGHGASTHGSSGSLSYESFDDAQWTNTRNDVIAAVTYLLGPDSGVAPASIAAIGASIGSSAVVAAAAEDSRISAVVAVSPGRAYHGFDSVTPATLIVNRPIFALASNDETDSVETAQAFGRLTGVPAHIIPGDAHGVVMFGTTPGTLDLVEDFLRTSLTWPRLAPRVVPTEPAAPPPTSVGTPVPG